MRAFDSYKWLSGEGGRDQALESLRNGVVPVLMPAAPARRARWQRVLRWYGGHEAAATSSAASRLGLPTPASDDWVVCLGDELAFAALTLAAAHGRPFTQIATLAEAGQLARRHASRSVLVFAPAPALTLAAIAALRESLVVPWGVLTARDAAGASFVTAKQLLPGRPEGAWALLDAGRRVVEAVDPSGRLVPLDRGLTWAVEEGDWDTLAITAHGEGSHLNLHERVLCGVADEAGAGAPEPDGHGCALGPSGHRCKRIQAAGVSPLAFAEVRAARVVLFSCNGFSVAGEQYPSSTSLVLAAADGHARALLTPDRKASFGAARLSATLAQLRAGVSLGALAGVENDLRQRSVGARPYVLFGDPAGAPAPRVALDGDGPLALPARQRAVVVDLGAWRDRGALAAPRGATLLRGRELAVLLRHEPAPGDVHLADRSAELATREVHWLDLARRVQNAMHLEQSAQLLYGDGALASEAGEAELLELVRTRMAASLLLQCGFQAFAEIRRTGVWDERMHTVSEAIAARVAEWDLGFAELASRRLMDDSFQTLWVHGFVRSRARARGPCRRCGLVLDGHSFEDPCGQLPRQQTSECATCGFHEAWSPLLARVEASLPARTHRGEPLHVCVRYRPDHADVGLVSPAQLVVQAKDKGTGKTFHRQIHVLDREEVDVEVPMPADLTADLHTIKLVVVQHMAASYLRVRRHLEESSHEV